MSTKKILMRVAIFLGGVAAGALAAGARKHSSAGTKDLQIGLASLENTLAAQAAADDERFSRIEARLEEHSRRLADAFSATQVVAAMEAVLVKTIGPLDARLTAQAKSMDVLKSTLAQTDGLLGRVLESLDPFGSLQSLESLQVGLQEGGAGRDTAFSNRRT